MSQESFFRVRLVGKGHVDFDAADDEEAMRFVTERWQRHQVASVIQYVGPPQARAQRRLWPSTTA